MRLFGRDPDSIVTLTQHEEDECLSVAFRGFAWAHAAASALTSFRWRRRPTKRRKSEASPSLAMENR